MVVYQKRNEILQSVLQEITRYGITAFRVEEISRRMGISKRTIYRIFPAKADLLRQCIVYMTRQLRDRILIYRLEETVEPLDRLQDLIGEYLDSLYCTEGIFLREMKLLPAYRDLYLEVREEWTTTFKGVLQQGQQQGYILEDTDCDLFCDRLMTTLYESRVEEELPRARQWMFCQTILRGIATEKGRGWLEARK